MTQTLKQYSQILFSLVLLIAIGSACECSTGSGGFTTPTITTAEVGTGKDDAFVAKSSLPSNVSEIVCKWKGGGIKKGSTLKAIWVADDTGGAAPPKTTLIEKTVPVDIDDTDGGNFSITPPDGGFPAGTYHVDLQVDGTMLKTANFTITK